MNLKAEDRISALPDDLLVQILSKVPTKVAVTTMILSKRWRFIWTMVFSLNYSESYEARKSIWDSYEAKKSIWNLLDKSLQLHKAPSLESLRIQLIRDCPVHADIGKWISHAVKNRNVRALELLMLRQPLLLPDCVYTSKTLVKLTLSSNILIAVPSLPSLPSLQSLSLTFVVYENKDSHVRLLSNCPVLKDLVLVTDEHDNVTTFIIKVPSLQRLTYTDYVTGLLAGGSHRFLVIDCPRLRYVKITNPLVDNISIGTMPCLEVAFLKVFSRFGSNPNYKFLTSFSSVMFLNLAMTKVACCSTLNFSGLIELKLSPGYLDYNWLESLMLLLHSSPKLQVLMINTINTPSFGCVPLSWSQLSNVPICVLSHLEIFEWEAYGGGKEEKEFVAYILANSSFLKNVRISLRSFFNCEEKRFEEKQKRMEELKSMYMVSASCQLTFHV